MNHLLSNILRGAWLIDEQAANGYMPYVLALINREPVSTARIQDEEASTLPFAISASGEAFTRFSAYDEAPLGAVAVVPVSGPMMTEDYCGSPGTRTIGQRIQQADAHENIAAIIVQFSSPGGTVLGTEHFASVIKNTKKPVVAFAEQMCSAAYWAGSGADAVVAAGQSAMIGSIGTMISFADYSARYEKEGIKLHNIRATESVDKNEAHYKAQSGDYTAIRAEMLDPLNRAFMGAVKENRDGKLDLKKFNVLTGKVYIGQDTVASGLADEVGTFERAVELALELANSQSTEQNSNSHTMFGRNKFAAVAALANLAVVESAKVEAANEELEAAGITGAALISKEDYEALQAKAARVDALTSENTTLTAEKETLVSEKATLEQNLVDANAKVAAYGAQPGATPTTETATTTEITEGAPAASLDTEAAAFHELGKSFKR
ncbi:S49 family peptidase [Pontibacter sp. SGAir0037]|uniref:S49 family peptidase n=1 Tax=Pontibacter sp. SGAir0037 TaxID=2571030 RepID=UPI0010CCC7F0|nr:S49 family peptidase [Pontibacter sp. SGAir0037]QCR23087.1 hypothetical protein C1N53_12515 [Pontibacter sp. SGAir0037]